MSTTTPSRGAARAVTIATIALGSAIILGTVGSAFAGTAAAASVQTSTYTADADGVESLEVRAADGSLRVAFADVDEAQLDVRGSWGADRWTLERDGDELTVLSPNDWLGGGWLFRGGPFGRSLEAVLLLPVELEGIDADLALSAGNLTAEGRFGDVDLDVSAGGLELTGSARELDAEVSAGRAELDLEGVSRATLGVSAGTLRTQLTGSAPTAVDVTVSAGSLRLSVPEGEYEVTSDVSAGSFDNDLGSTPGASRTIRVEVSAGSANLRAN